MRLEQKVALNTAALVAARAVSVVAGVIGVALASRYLEPAGYGAFTIAAAFVAIAAVFVDLGIYTIAAREISRAPDQERHVAGNVLTLTLAISVAVAVLAVGAMLLIYSGPEHELTRKGILVLLPELIAAAPIAASRARLIASQRIWVTGIAEATTGLVTVLLIAVSVGFDLGFTAIVAATTIGFMAQAVVMVSLLPGGSRLPVSFDIRSSRRLLLLALPLGLTLIVNFLYFRLDVLLLSFLKTDVDVALYGLAYKVIEAFIVLPSYFMTALFPEIARMEPHSERLGSVIGQALAVMELIALPVVVLTVVFADEIVQVVGGDQFGDASHALRLLTIGVGVSFLNGVYGNALVALGRQKQLLWLSMAVLVFNVALNLVLIPPFGVDGAATAVAASEVLAYFVVRGLFGRVATTPRRTGRLRVLLAAAGMAVAVPIQLALTSAGAGALVVALVGGVAGLVAYIALLIALGAVPAPIEDHILSPLRARLRRS